MASILIQLLVKRQCQQSAHSAIQNVIRKQVVLVRGRHSMLATFANISKTARIVFLHVRKARTLISRLKKTQSVVCATHVTINAVARVAQAVPAKTRATVHVRTSCLKRHA